MLKFLIPFFLLLLLSTSWSYILMSSMSLMLLGLILIPYSFNSALPMNNLMTLDPLSATLIILTLWITPLMLIASQNIKLNSSQPKKFTSLMLLLTIILVITFSTSNMFMFYVFFEASLIPTLLIILNWGYQPERLQAGMYLMLYTITASLPLLMGITVMLMKASSLNMISPTPSPSYSNYLWWLTLNTAFMVKLPLFFSHLWLPKAHVEAPVAGSMVLAAILLKLGGYGMLRLSNMISPLIPLTKFLGLAICLWGGMITSLICIRQSDMKSLIAYSSVGHMSLVMGGILSQSTWGLWGALIMMLAHGLVSSAMFAMANTTYELTNSRSMILNKGMLVILPSASMMWFLMSAANMAAPPSINLLAEIMLISVTFSQAIPMGLPLMIMSFSAAAYSIILYTAINHGPLNSNLNNMVTLSPRNYIIPSMHLLPIILLISAPFLISHW